VELSLLILLLENTQVLKLLTQSLALYLRYTFVNFNLFKLNTKNIKNKTSIEL